MHSEHLIFKEALSHRLLYTAEIKICKSKYLRCVQESEYSFLNPSIFVNPFTVAPSENPWRCIVGEGVSNVDYFLTKT